MTCIYFANKTFFNSLFKIKIYASFLLYSLINPYDYVPQLLGVCNLGERLGEGVVESS